MKMVKSLLLGTAAGLVAMSGAQAADLPVKAKPVQYVKICSLYGAGFYYVPGTDMCLKIGGWVRQYLGANSNGSFTNGFFGTNGNTETRGSNNGWGWKVRGYITADARSQTEWGTVRGYLAVGTNIQGTNGGQGASGASGVNTGGFNANRAFIQFAGFTFGVAQSFYDLYPTPAISYFGGMAQPSSDTGDGGQTVTAYTAQFGNGFSASISAEAPRTTLVAGPTTTIAPSGTAGTTNTAAAVRYPDVIGNLRIDQAWGSAQVMGGIHDATGNYIGATTATGAPNSVMGWVVGAGIKLNAPMIGPGDYVSAQVNYTEGAAGYVDDGATLAAPGGGGNANTAPGSYAYFGGGTGANYGLGIVSDNVYNAAGTNNLTTTWGVNAGYEHFWNKSWQTSLYGSYMHTSYNTTANTQLCALEAVGVSAALTVGGGCNNNWSYWVVGTRTQWNIDSQTYMGLDVIYENLNTSSQGVVGTVATSGFQPAAVRTFANDGQVVLQARVHRNFYP